MICVLTKCKVVELRVNRAYYMQQALRWPAHKEVACLTLKWGCSLCCGLVADFPLAAACMQLLFIIVAHLELG